MSHLILDIGEIVNEKTLNSMTELIDIFDDICKTYDFNVLNRFFYQFKPQGITIIYALSESHLSIHTYPEKNEVAIDLYTCRPNDEKTLEKIKDYFVYKLSGTPIKDVIVKRSIM
jgi:S-adenosylmethionine decarboxylase proenzyme